MMVEEPEVTSLSSTAALISQALYSYGCAPAPLFARAGIPLSEISDPNVRHPTARLQKLWALAIEATGDPCFGLTAATQFQPAAIHGLGFAWLASDTLHDGLGRLVRFSRFLNPMLEARLEESKISTDLVLLGPEKWPGFVYAAADLAMAAILRMCQITVGNEIKPLHVAMQRPRVDCEERFIDLFGPSIEYDSPDNRLCFDRKHVYAPLLTAHPELARVNDQTVIDYLARFDRGSVAMQVRAKIIEQLPDGIPRQEQIADALYTSLRSLQRRLKQEETSFKRLLEDTRKELARQYLRDSHRPIGEITYLLGFSEPSNFTRAFKRWTGQSPMEYRETACSIVQ